VHSNLASVKNILEHLFALSTPGHYHEGMSSVRRLERVEALDIDALDAGAVTAALRDLTVVKGVVDHLAARLLRRNSELSEHGQAAPTADVIGRVGRMSRRAAERAERRADALGHTPQLDIALGKGKIAEEHADVVAVAASRLDDVQRRQLFDHDGELTERASATTPEQFRRDVNRLVDRITRDDGLERAARQHEAATLAMGVNAESGMYWIRGELAPEDGVRVRHALTKRANVLAKRPEHATRRRDQIDAAALVDVVTGARSRSGPQTAQVAIFVPLATLTGCDSHPTPAEYSDGTAMPVETARRLACDADIIPVVLSGAGLPLDVGRARRLATPEQRVALRSMYRTCAIDGCDRHFDLCHIHHIVEWEHGGFTDLANMVPLCSHHHHRAHEGRWQLRLDASSRQLTVTLPNGSIHSVSVPDAVAASSSTQRRRSVGGDAMSGTPHGRKRRPRTASVG
jgi:hypothetical protein